MDAARCVLFSALLASACGCTTAHTSNTARTATEQLLISNAVDHSLSKVDFRPFAGRNVYLEEKYVDCVDKNYVIGSIRHRLLTAGAALVATADAAEIVVEPRSGGVGTTTSESFVGIPEVALPGMVTLPEVRFLTRNKQAGTAKIGLVAYDAKTKQAIGAGGLSLAKADDNNWFVVGMGPYRTGSLKKEITRGTTGRAAWTQDTIPSFVTFAAPASTAQVQMASATREAAKPATPPTNSPPSAPATDAKVPATIPVSQARAMPTGAEKATTPPAEEPIAEWAQP